MDVHWEQPGIIAKIIADWVEKKFQMQRLSWFLLWRESIQWTLVSRRGYVLKTLPPLPPYTKQNPQIRNLLIFYYSHPPPPVKTCPTP